MATKMHRIFIYLFNFLLLYCVPIVVKSEDVRIFFDVHPSNASLSCNANTPSVIVKDGDDVKFHIITHSDVCRVLCKVQTTNQVLINVSLKTNDTCARSFEERISDNIKMRSNLDGIWECSIFVSKEHINGVVNNTESSLIPVNCIIHMYVEKSHRDLAKQPQPAISDYYMWIYAGCGIGAIVLIVIITQTILVCYFKRKARIAIQRSRHENLSTKTYSESSNPEKGRYSTTPGSKSKFKKNLDEQTLYESVEDLASDPALIEEQKRTPIEMRPKMPLPTDEGYEDMDVTDSGAANSKRGQIKTIDESRHKANHHHSTMEMNLIKRRAPPLPSNDNSSSPSSSSLPRPPRRLPPQVTPLHVNTNQKIHQQTNSNFSSGPRISPSPIGASVIFELDNVLKKKVNAASKPEITRKRPQPAPKPNVLRNNLPTLTTNIPVNVVNNDDQSNDFNSSDEEWTYEPLKDINFSNYYNNI